MKGLHFKNKLRLARQTVNLTQAELAEKVGVTRQTIGLIESGNYNPTIKLCLLLAKETTTSLDELFWIEGDKNE